MKVKTFLKRYKTLFVFLFLLLALVFAYKKLVIWEEESEISLKSELSEGTINNKQPLGKSSSKSDSEPIPTVQVKGRITVTVTKELQRPFTDALVTLRNAGGDKTLRRGETGKSGTVVFDEVSAGTYQVGAQRIGDGRIISKIVSLDEGEVTSLGLALYLDTEVSITVSVKNNQGQPLSNQTFTLTKAGGPEFSVTTDGSGRFVQSGVSPDDNWKLSNQEGKTVTFKVNPTGQDQKIAVVFP